MTQLRIAIIGCGQIKDQYGQHILRYPETLKIAGATDLDLARAQDFCQKYGGKVYPDIDSVLNDPEVDAVIDLTIHHAHFDVNKRALLAGKHVFTEKPMALTFAQAKELRDLAKQCNRHLLSAPTTYLGEGIQTAGRILQTGLIGDLRLVYAEVNWGQIDRWIGSPAPYFTVGPLLDVGVYAIMALTYLLGPVSKVWGFSHILKNPRYTPKGDPFPVTAPDFTTGIMHFANGVVCRLTTNYYVPTQHQRHLRGFEFHGDQGSYSVSDYHDFTAVCRYLPYSQPGIDIPLLRPAELHIDRAIALSDLSEAIRDNRAPICSTDHAVHVVEVMECLQRSHEEQRTIELTSTCPTLSLLPWAQKAELVIPEQS